MEQVIYILELITLIYICLKVKQLLMLVTLNYQILLIIRKQQLILKIMTTIVLYTKNVKKCLKSPYFISCDFESFTTKKCVNNCTKFKPCIFCENNGEITDYLKVEEVHIPASYKLMLVDTYNPDNSISIIDHSNGNLEIFQLFILI